MDESQGAIWFFGDLSDPWVVSIADALPAAGGVIRMDCSGEQLKEPYGAHEPPRLIVVHRQRLFARDADRFKEWRTQIGSLRSPALILCAGPYVRYEELERYSGLVDLVLSEATAAEVLPRHANRLLEGRSSRPARGEGDSLVRVLVASSNSELRETIAEACAGAGYRVEQADEHMVGARVSFATGPAAPDDTILTVWDVPVLEEWEERLERHAREAGPIVALIGFADRSTVAVAKANGAFACLELPLNLDDLIDVIERFAQCGNREPRPAPARAEAPHTLPPRPRRGAAERRSPAEQKQWSGPARTPRILNEPIDD